jgi:hypothetical protein
MRECARERGGREDDRGEGGCVREKERGRTRENVCVCERERGGGSMRERERKSAREGREDEREISRGEGG